MKRLAFFLTSWFAALALLAPSSAQAQPAREPDLQALDGYIGLAVRDMKLPGLAIAVLKDGEVVMERGYGKLDLEKEKNVDGETIFGIASCSKAFTAAAIGMLVEDGKLDWDDKVVDILPEFQLYDPYATREMRVRDLLCHRSGLGTFDGDLLWYGTDYTRDEVVERIRHLPPRYSFRAKFGYQNIMYIVAGEVIEKVSGMTWDDFIKERFLKPMEMKRTFTSNERWAEKKGLKDKLMPVKNVARPHLDGKPQEYLDYDNSGPAASMNSCVSDLAKWTSIWLNDGVYNETQILKPETMAELTRQHTVLPVSKFDQSIGTNFKGYGLGWFVFDYHGKKVVEHDGGLPGYISKVMFVPEEKLGVVILTNGMSNLPDFLRNKILDEYVGGINDTIDWAKLALKYSKRYEEIKATRQQRREESRMVGTESAFMWKEYAGTYEDKMYGRAEIAYDDQDEKLTLSMLPTKELFTGELYHWHLDTWRVKFNDPFLPPGFITFRFDSEGHIDSFTIDLPNPDFHFYNLKFEPVEETPPTAEAAQEKKEEEE